MIIDEIRNFYLIPDANNLIDNINSRFSHKRIEIIQKNGKKRIVYEPNSIIKMCQMYILQKYLSELKYSDCAIAYTKNKSILNMAIPHTKNKYFLHVDIKHYFDNMTWDNFVKIVKTCYKETRFAVLLDDELDSFYTKKILTYNGIFRQGSVSSPYISNIYFEEIDNQIKEYVKNNVRDGVYTRYSDDLFISSSEYIKIDVLNFIKQSVKKINLKLNYSKLKFSRMADSVRIVGLSINFDQRICVNTNFKKTLKKDVYNFLHKNKHKCTLNNLLGRLYFLEMADTLYFNKLQIKYSENGKLLIDRLMNKK